MYAGQSQQQQQQQLPAPVMLPPLHYQGLDSPQPFGLQPPPQVPPAGMAASPPLGMHPSRMAALAVGTPPIPGGGGAGGGGPQVGMVRSAEQMEGIESAGDNVPPAKKQRVARVPGSQLYPEQNWIDLHPVRLFFSKKKKLKKDTKTKTSRPVAPNLSASPAPHRRLQACMEARREHRDSPRDPGHVLRLDAPRPRRAHDREQRPALADHPVVQREDADECEHVGFV